MLNFNDTKVAFKIKSNTDLKRAYWLFRIIGSPAVVKVGKFFMIVALRLRIPVNFIVKRTIFKQFCGGETISECTETIHSLGAHKIGTILDYSVEGKIKEDDFDQTANIIIQTIEKAASEKSIPFAVFKITGISEFSLLEKASENNKSLTQAEEHKLNQVKTRINNICQRANQLGVPVFIDAEESWVQDIIDQWAFEMMLRYNKEKCIVYNTIQMYRHDRMDYLKTCFSRAKEANISYGVKLVRGAYMEKERLRAEENNYPCPIQPDKESCDRDYDIALDYILDNINYFSLVAGTHNEGSSKKLALSLSKRNLSKDDSRIFFAQLLGMSDHISFNLAHHKFNVAKYVPFGPVKEVMPYLLRRADENTSVAGQTGRELSLIKKELKNRKTKVKTSPA